MENVHRKAVEALLNQIYNKSGKEVSPASRKYNLDRWNDDLSGMSEKDIQRYTEEVINSSLDFTTIEVDETIFPDSKIFSMYIIPKLLASFLSEINSSLGSKYVTDDKLSDAHSSWLVHVQRWRIPTFMETRKQFLKTWRSYGKFPEFRDFLDCKMEITALFFKEEFKITPEIEAKRNEFFKRFKGKDAE